MAADDEFHFSLFDYNKICDCALAGELEELKSVIEDVSQDDRARFGTSTFCPDPSLHLASPFVVAAQHGHLAVLRYLTETFPDFIDINRGASVVSKTQHIKTHNVPPLVAACTNDNLDLVKYLVELGADIHKQSLTRATPLRAAAYYGYLNIMEYLIENGADLDKANCIGSSPLLAAAHSGGAEAAIFLLKKGCDATQRTIEGYTAMHEAAQKGKVDIVKALLDFGISPQFAPAAEPVLNQQQAKPDNRYVPCPLFLAASMDRREVFDLLIEHPDCTLECKADAYLLLATSLLEYSSSDQNYDEVMDQCFQFWRIGLEIAEQLSEQSQEYPQMEEYLNHKEIRSKEELQSLWGQPVFKSVALPMQCLIIRERCMGIEDQSLIECLAKRGIDFLYQGHYKEFECVSARAMLVEETICEMECNDPEYGYCDGIMKDLESDMSDYIEGVTRMALDNYPPNYSRVFKFGLNCLQYLKRLKTNKADGEVITLRPIILNLLTLLCLWISNEFNAADRKGPDNDFEPSNACISACKELVGSYLKYEEPFNLLHDFLTHVTPFTPGDLAFAVTLETLLSCGAYVCVNEPFPDPPLHCIFLSSSFLSSSRSGSDAVNRKCLSTLIEFGAHRDTVNDVGECFLDWNDGFHASSHAYLNSLGPLSLTCLAARALVRDEVDYLHTGLPTHVVAFIKLHDSKFAERYKTPLEKYFGSPI